MCLIIIKDKNVKMPSYSTIERMMDINRDGAGFMFSRGGNVVISKGYYSSQALWRAIQKAEIQDDEVLVIHARWSTQAGNSPYLCHPYPLTNNLNYMSRLDCVCDVGICHNGIIFKTSDYTELRYNDTMLYIQKYIYKYYLNNGRALQKSDYLRIKNEINGSRLCFLFSNNSFQIVGSWYRYKGLLFSNDELQRTERFNNLQFKM